MSKPTLYYNPRCSKSRGALELLESRGIDLVIVEYLDAPPDRETLISVINACDSRPSEFVRTGDQAFKDAGIDLSEAATAEEVAGVLAQCPAALQRPIFVTGGKSIIARPPERALELL